MAISECDACGKVRPGSSGTASCGTEGFFCHICCGDELDPYCELEIDCAMCDGAGCHLCDRSGKLYVVTEPATLDDLDELDELDEDESAESKARTAEAMRMVDETIAMIRQVVEAV